VSLAAAPSIDHRAVASRESAPASCEFSRSRRVCDNFAVSRQSAASPLSTRGRLDDWKRTRRCSMNVRKILDQERLPRDRGNRREREREREKEIFWFQCSFLSLGEFSKAFSRGKETRYLGALRYREVGSRRFIEISRSLALRAGRKRGNNENR